MQVGAIGGVKNIFNNIARASQNHHNTQKVNRPERRDSASISRMGKAANRIETLTKQKQSIAESRERLVIRTLEKGKKLETIQLQLDTFDEQLKNIDEQIARLATEQAVQLMQKQEQAENEKPKTEEELQAEQLNSVVHLSTGAKQAQTISSVKTKADGEAAVLKSEIELDRAHGGSMSVQSRGIERPSTRTARAAKVDRLAEMQDHSERLSALFGEEMATAKSEISDGVRAKPAVPEKTEEEEETARQEREKNQADG